MHGETMKNVESLLITNKHQITVTSSWFYYLPTPTMHGHMNIKKIWIYLGLHVQCLILLSSFNQLWSSWTDFCKSLQYQISRRSFHWQLQWYMQTDKWTTWQS